jgi:hypothetical protein
MSRAQRPPDSLYIRYGKFQAGATGRPALRTLALIAIVALMGLGLWLRFH